MIRRIIEAIDEKEFTPRADVTEPDEPFAGCYEEPIGGGGAALALHFDDGGWVWITDSSGIGIPQPGEEEVVVGLYPPGAHESGVGSTTMVTYDQAVGAAKALLPAKNHDEAFGVMKDLGLMVDNP